MLGYELVQLTTGTVTRGEVGGIEATHRRCSTTKAAKSASAIA